MGTSDGQYFLSGASDRFISLWGPLKSNMSPEKTMGPICTFSMDSKPQSIYVSTKSTKIRYMICSTSSRGVGDIWYFHKKKEKIKKIIHKPHCCIKAPNRARDAQIFHMIFNDKKSVAIVRGDIHPRI